MCGSAKLFVLPGVLGPYFKPHFRGVGQIRMCPEEMMTLMIYVSVPVCALKTSWLLWVPNVGVSHKCAVQCLAFPQSLGCTALGVPVQTLHSPHSAQCA